MAETDEYSIQILKPKNVTEIDLVKVYKFFLKTTQLEKWVDELIQFVNWDQFEGF